MKEIAQMKLRILLEEAEMNEGRITVPYDIWKLLQRKIGKFNLNEWVMKNNIKVNIGD